MSKNEDWMRVSEGIKSRWDLRNNELIQASGIDELAGLISRKTGEPRPNVLHELMNLVREQDPESPLVDEFISESRRTPKGDESSEGRV